jgi:cell division protein FtsI (penicillin-binding protein 3)
VARPGYRYLILFLLLISLGAYIAVRYLTLAIEGPLPRGATEGLRPDRGRIFDRTGRILAVDNLMYNLSVWKPAVSDPKAAADILERVSGLKPSETLAALSSVEPRYLVLKKRIGLMEAKALDEAFAEAREAGFKLEPLKVRVYPEKGLAAHAIGYVGDDGKGLGGIELSEEAYLAPKGSAAGADVYLSIDSGVQLALEGIARKAIVEENAESLMFIAMEPSTGEILGYVSLPSFDPNDLKAASADSLMDRPALYGYEPGSVFKLISIASLMQMGALSEDSTFYCDGAYRRALPSGETITIKCEGSHGLVGPAQILRYSCNAGIGYASDLVSPRDFYEALRAFGFGSKTGARIPGETAGLLRPVNEWSLRTKPTIAFGQEILVSALQMTAAGAAIANGGMLNVPRLVKRIVPAEGPAIEPVEAQGSHRVIDADVAKRVLGLMEKATASSSTSKAKLDDVLVAAKTGTAQVIDPKTGGYSSTDYTASVMSIIPAEDPRLLLYVVIRRPLGKSYYGGQIAAPLAKQAAEALIPMLGIARGRDIVIESEPSPQAGILEPDTKGSIMPDLMGTPKRLLLGLLERDDIKLSISGDGYVVEQQPAPGTQLKPGDEIRLRLE